MKSKTEKKSPLKDKPLRYAGQSLQELIEDKVLVLVYWILVACGSIILTLGEWNRYANPRPAQPLPITLFTIVIIIIGFYEINKGRKEISRLRMARDGEKIVAEELQALIKDGATVIHDVLANNFNIDHVVVSKHGIYLIETKTLSKPVKRETKITFYTENIYVDGRSMDRNPIEQVKASSDWLQKLLKESTGIKFKIHPVILFPGWYTEKMKGGENIWILNPKALPTFISNEPAVLKDTDVHLVAFHLSRYVRTFTPKAGK